MRLASRQDTDNVSSAWPKCVDCEFDIRLASNTVQCFHNASLSYIIDLFQSGSVIGVADNMIRAVTLDEVE